MRSFYRHCTFYRVSRLECIPIKKTKKNEKFELRLFG